MSTIDLGIWFAPEALPAPAAAAFAARVEELGYSTLWLAETFGRDPFALAAHLGTATERLTLATGIANIYHRHAGVMLQGANTVAEQTGGRFVLGLGTSSPQIVTRGRGIDSSRPLSYMRDYLDTMAASRYLSVPPPAPVPVVLAALGPKMLDLAATRTTGALTYNTTPEHTARARAILGDGARLSVEQKVVFTTDAERARSVAAGALKFYLRAPGYRNMWLGCGFTEDEIDQLTPRFLDAVVVWGDAERIRGRVAEHAAAGADHVCLQPLHPEHGVMAVDHDMLAALAPGTR